MVVRNESARGLWLFMAVWMGILTTVTWTYVREVDLQQAVQTRYAPYILAFFWLGGAFFTRFALSRRRIELRLEPAGRVIILRKGLFSSERWEGRATDVSRVVVAEDRDSDGDPYFRCNVVGPFGTVTVAEGHHRPILEETARRITDRLARP